MKAFSEKSPPGMVRHTLKMLLPEPQSNLSPPEAMNTRILLTCVWLLVIFVSIQGKRPTVGGFRPFRGYDSLRGVKSTQGAFRDGFSRVFSKEVVETGLDGRKTHLKYEAALLDEVFIIDEEESIVQLDCHGDFVDFQLHSFEAAQRLVADLTDKPLLVGGPQWNCAKGASTNHPTYHLVEDVVVNGRSVRAEVKEISLQDLFHYMRVTFYTEEMLPEGADFAFDASKQWDWPFSFNYDDSTGRAEKSYNIWSAMNGQVSVDCVNCYARLNVALSLQLDVTRENWWSLPSVDVFEAKLTGKWKANIDVNMTIDAKSEYETQELFSLNGPFISFAIGPIPVVVTSNFAMKAGFSAFVKGTIYTGASVTGDVLAGIRYDSKNGWNALKGFNNKFEVIPPRLAAGASAHAEAYLKPVASVFLYSVSGPTFTFQPTVYFDWNYPGTNCSMAQWGAYDVGAIVKADVVARLKWSFIWEFDKTSEKLPLINSKYSVSSGCIGGDNKPPTPRPCLTCGNATKASLNREGETSYNTCDSPGAAISGWSCGSDASPAGKQIAIQFTASSRGMYEFQVQGTAGAAIVEIRGASCCDGALACNSSIVSPKSAVLLDSNQVVSVITGFTNGKCGAVTLTISRVKAKQYYFVSPTGSSSGDGTRSNPLNLATALSRAGAIDILILTLLPGKYGGPFPTVQIGADSHLSLSSLHGTLSGSTAEGWVTGTAADTIIGPSDKSCLSVVSASSDARVSLTGLTFQGCKSSSGWGGAIFAHNAKLVLKNVRFYDNAAIRGGAFALNGSQADCIRCKFDGNIALTHGNDIFVARDGILQTDECLFKAPGRSGQRNTPFFGGHIAIGDSQSGGGLAIRRSCFLDAYSPDTGIGGSIAILTQSYRTSYIQDSTFVNGWFAIGGAIYARLFNDQELQVQASIFTTNKVSFTSGVALGGAIFTNGGILKISNGTALECNSAAMGGAIYANRTRVFIDSSIVSGNILAGPQRGGAGLAMDTSSLSIGEQTIIRANTASSQAYDWPVNIACSNSPSCTPCMPCDACSYCDPSRGCVKSSGRCPNPDYQCSNRDTALKFCKSL